MYLEPTQRSKTELFCENKHLKLESEITIESHISLKKLHHVCLTGFSIHLYGIQFRIHFRGQFVKENYWRGIQPYYKGFRDTH